MAAKSRIMYLEKKEGGQTGPAWIGRVSFSKTGQTLYYRGRSFQSSKGTGIEGNYHDVETGEEWWISGPKRRGGDRLWGNSEIEIDEDVREEYWTTIRGRPSRRERTTA